MAHVSDHLTVRLGVHLTDIVIVPHILEPEADLALPDPLLAGLQPTGVERIL